MFAFFAVAETEIIQISENSRTSSQFVFLISAKLPPMMIICFLFDIKKCLSTSKSSAVESIVVWSNVALKSAGTHLMNPVLPIKSSRKSQSCLMTLTTQKSFGKEGGLLNSEVAFLILTQQPRVRFPAFQKVHFDVAQIYSRWWSEERG